MTIKMTEGWVTFQRTPCKEGYIDRWAGDSINDPNNETKHQMCLNSFTYYFRLNDGKWIHKHELGRNPFADLWETCEHFTAQEIWNEQLRQAEKIK